jgi:hypothetical protein
MAIKWHEDPNGYVVYTNSRTKEKVRIWSDTLAEVAFICQDWHGGQVSSCYRTMSGDYSYENLDRTLTELRRALDEADDRDDEDDYFDLAETVDDLSGVIGRISKIL